MRESPRLLKPTPARTQGQVVYAAVGLRRDGKTHPKRMHQLVLLAFVGPCPDGLEILHGDGDGLNNRLDNLRYGTHAENGADIVRHGSSQAKEGDKDVKLNPQKVREIRRLIAAGVEQDDVAERFGIAQQTVSCIHRRKTWKHVV